MNLQRPLRIVLVFVLSFLASRISFAQIAPEGQVIIQNPANVYYIFGAGGTYQNGASFLYINYATDEVDAITPTISSNGAFSGFSQVTGRSLSGQISANSITLTYNGASQGAAKLSSYGPTRAFAGGWIGEVTDPSTGTGVGEALITSNGRVVVFSFQDFFSDAGVGTIDSSGNISIPLLTGRTIAGVFSPSNGTAQGTFSISTGGTQSYSLVRAVPARLSAISTRGLVGTGEQVLIGGFIIVDGGKTVVIRALGPSLSQFNIQNPVQSTRLDLYLGQQVIASNNGWQNDFRAAELAAGGFAPGSPKESAIQVGLEPGAYTVVVSSGDASTGIGLVEVYGVGNTGGP